MDLAVKLAEKILLIASVVGFEHDLGGRRPAVVRDVEMVAHLVLHGASVPREAFGLTFGSRFPACVLIRPAVDEDGALGQQRRSSFPAVGVRNGHAT